MKQSSLTPAEFPESIHHQLNIYALGATAAGVSLLALAQPSEAKIVYTPAHHVIGENSQYSFALNHKTPDFIISNTSCDYGSRCNSDQWTRLTVHGAGGPSSNNEVEGTSGNQYLAVALKAGARISGVRQFIGGAFMAQQIVGCCTHSKTYTSGPWVNVSDRYLGLKFKINGKFHYGWARLKVKVLTGHFHITATLTGYAYETIPNKPIIAGQTKGPDDSTVGPSASLTDPASQPAALGLLALGSPGLSIWRRKDNQSPRQDVVVALRKEDL